MRSIAGIRFSFSDLAGLPKSVREDMFSKQEIAAIDGIAKLREEAFEKDELLGCICTKAALEGIKLPKNCTKELTGTILQGRHWPDEELEQPSTQESRRVFREVERRRSIVQGMLRSDPGTKGTNLDLLTCLDLDQCRVGFPPVWRIQHKIQSWEEGYNHPKVKLLIEKMLSDDRHI